MKKTIKIFVLGLLSAALFSCQDAALPTIDNMVYISDAANGKLGVANMADAGNTELTFTVRLAQKATEDVKVAIIVDTTVLKNYNETYQYSIKHVAAENIEVPVLAIIPAGSVVSEPITMSINEFDPKGAQYAVSIRIVSKGSVPVAETSSKYIIQLMKPLKQYVPKFSRACAMQCYPLSDWRLSLMNYTLEWWVKMTGFQVNNQAIINSGSNYTDDNSELYIRFGDEVYGRTYFNYLQIKTMGSQADTGDPRIEGQGLKTNTWYHFAISYDGASGKSIIYKDGEIMAELNTGGGRPMIIDRFQMCSSNSYFRDQAEMCQVRLWNTTRTQAQIQKNMNSEVDYSDPTLEMYLPMNEGPNKFEQNGNVKINDVTGKGHDTFVGNLTGSGGSGNGTQPVAWTEYAF